MLAYSTTEESLSSQDLADKIPQTRMDVRLAIRASLRYNAPPAQEAGAFAPDEVAEVIAEIEDDAWLNDVAQPKHSPVLRTPIARKQLAGDHTLTCWL